MKSGMRMKSEIYTATAMSNDADVALQEAVRSCGAQR